MWQLTNWLRSQAKEGQSPVARLQTPPSSTPPPACAADTAGQERYEAEKVCRETRQHEGSQHKQHNDDQPTRGKTSVLLPHGLGADESS